MPVCLTFLGSEFAPALRDACYFVGLSPGSNTGNPALALCDAEDGVLRLLLDTRLAATPDCGGVEA